MYLLYTDLSGVLADYSLSSRAQPVDAGLSCKGVGEPDPTAPPSAPSRLTSLLRKVNLRRSGSTPCNSTGMTPADMFEGNRS
jgi:hypothetical protein